jgi:hypothetical protein
MKMGKDRENRFFLLVFFILTVLLVLTSSVLISCKKNKKEKLEGSESQFVGTYEWNSTCGGFAPHCDFPLSSGFTLSLEISGNGKYTLLKNGKAHTQGTLYKDDQGFITFQRSGKGTSDELSGLRILGLRNDSLDIGDAYCCDTMVSVYLKTN